MLRPRAVAFVLLALGVLFLATVSHATSRVKAQSPFFTNNSAKRIDKVPPPVPDLVLKRVWREAGAEYYSEKQIYSPDLAQEGMIELAVSPPADSLEHFGYVYHLVDGQLPDGLSVPVGAWTALDGFVFLEWDDRATWYQEPFSFRMCVTAVDSAGNESGASNVVTVADDGQQGVRFERFRRSRWESEHYRNYMLRGTFEGYWDGKDERGKKVRLVFDHGRFELTIADSTRVGFASASKRNNSGYVFDCIDFEYADEPSPTGWRSGIFELHQNSLVICMPSATGTRPATFVAGPTAHRYDLIRTSISR